MEVPPLQHQRQRPGREMPFYLTVADANGDLATAVSGVKVGGLVFAMVDDDDNSEEATYFRHALILPGTAMAA
jgi:hypothetical protein